ncbi:DUF2141 domain-containing protein [Novosphingobium rosa]|uniref:DUF2141 domain-containing protein n=1 Tax=Novosphingobium rosa TaxID=76978 RepID=UPI0008359333|nr:DUF2141 domain-containing protein [Novosphingobium rosa]
MIPALLLLAGAAATTGAPLVVQVGNVRNAHGRVIVAICPQDKWLAENCAISGSVPAHPGVTTVTIEHVPPGEWGAQAFLDENGNTEIDRGIFGIPKEGVGFSRDAKIVMSPPKWRDAVFNHGAAAQTISFSLRYFTGPKSPEEWRKEKGGQ